MSVKPGEKKTVTLLPLHVIMKQSKDMVLFTITDYALVHAKDPGEGIRMTITLKGKIMSEILLTYFPSLLLMMITYATTFFKPFFFEAALSVNLTTMLMMTTIFISNMESLPPTSVIKMVDYWLILCQLVPFAQVVLLTVKENLRESGHEENLILEDDHIQQPVGTKINSVEDASNPKEAWVISDTKSSKGGPLAMVTMIGR